MDFKTESTHPTLEQQSYTCDFAVVGGGMSGLCAAVTAARNGLSTILIQDRPVLGGNGSSEIRMGVSGHTGTGLMEELLLENIYMNPRMRFTVWDHVLYGFARRESNLKLLLNTAVTAVQTEGNRILSVEGFNVQEYTRIQVKATYFADCSGDGILRLSHAEYMSGREAKDEFNEPDGRDVRDSCTMGNSVLLQLRKCSRHIPFKAPAWAYHYDDETFPKYRDLSLDNNNFWWVEVGGNMDTIRDADAIRDDVYKVAYGVWEYMKNHPKGNAHNYELAWIGSLPGKRESVRFVGDHILTQNDIAETSDGTFHDAIARGNWPMDDHHPDGFKCPDGPNRNLKTREQYHIPYRSLYSRNIENLFFAGRQISATHLAMSSTRVMGTCGAMGQAVGTAVALAFKYNCTPRDVYRQHLTELQQTLLKHDQHIPRIPIQYPELALQGAISHEVLRDGNEYDADHALQLSPGETCGYHFNTTVAVEEIRLVFDSDVTDPKRLPCFDDPDYAKQLPKYLPKDFDLEICQDGTWHTWKEIRDNYRRLVLLTDVTPPCQAIRMKLISSWGQEKAGVFAFTLDGKSLPTN